MILELKKTIAEHPEWLKRPGSRLTFMKASTPSSGSEKGRGKVLVFVFEEGEDRPTLCAKVTRDYAHGKMIRDNHENLKALNAGVAQSEFADLFAKPLYIYDDGRLVFCIESICPGEKFSAQRRSWELVIEKYMAWQSSLAKSAKKFVGVSELRQMAFEAIDRLGLPAGSSQVLKNYYDTLPVDPDARLPLILQHGDMTPDNVLVSGRSIYFVDYDNVGASRLPGFDLFHFLSKSSGGSAELASIFEDYFPAYFERVGAKVGRTDAIIFIYYLEESLRKNFGGEKRDGAGMIKDFEAMYSTKSI